MAEASPATGRYDEGKAANRIALRLPTAPPGPTLAMTNRHVDAGRQIHDRRYGLPHLPPTGPGILIALEMRVRSHAGSPRNT